MAINNRERVGRGFDLLSKGLEPVVNTVLKELTGTDSWQEQWAKQDTEKFGGPARIYTKADVQVQLRALTEHSFHFKHILSRAQQGFASELRETRNQWAHSEPFSTDDAARALDTMERLLTAVAAQEEAEEVRKLRVDLQRTAYEDQTRQKVRKSSVSIEPGTGLKPWRDVIQPHDDVARGAFNASEFAANLHTVHNGQATSVEYSDPVEFFNRTFLTAGLKDLLGRALKRLSGDANASPVVNLQTNFGGGKTHALLSLYHLFSGTSSTEFSQELQELVTEAGNPSLKDLKVRRVALVGTELQAGSPSIKSDGTEVRTIWGELAWQLGGAEGFASVAEADSHGTNPGEALRTLIEQNSPALILIDEWVAYARQLVTHKPLPAGSFETQFTFAQSLTEIVQSVPGALLVVSIPASDTGEAGIGSDIEIGGANGQLALERLQNVIRRVADQWRPSSKDESFEIVRRRLFKTPDAESLTQIAATARSFANFYRSNPTVFPQQAATPSDDYEKRIRASFPLHPELLDRLYEDWSTLERFQRTRGVLKLVSSIVHELWTSNDRSELILPANVPLDSSTVNTDLTQYLEDSWKPIIDSDIDGVDSTAHNIDKDKPALGQRFVTQRLARTIFMGAAPRVKTNRKGIDKQYVWLGTAVPGDVLGNFGTALEQLSQRSTYFYEQDGHYWFDTQASVTKTANDYAERLRQDNETVWNEIIRRLKKEQTQGSFFSRVHSAPLNSGEIPDLEEVRLVIVHPEHSHSRQDSPDSKLRSWICSAVETRGSGHRAHRNTLIFLAADRADLETLESAARQYLGWQQVQTKKETMNLSPQQAKQADESVARLDAVVNDRIRQAYSWVAYPEQLDPAKPFELVIEKLPEYGNQNLAERVSTKLARDGQIIDDLGAAILGATLNKELKNIWREQGELTVGELWAYFTRYTYLSRLVDRNVLDQSIKQSLNVVLVEEERFALAQSKDTETGRYIGLIQPPSPGVSLQITDQTLLVEWGKAEAQREADRTRSTEQGEPPAVAVDGAQGSGDVNASASGRVVSSGGAGSGGTAAGAGERKPLVDDHQTRQKPVRFFGSVKINPERYARDLATISKEIIDRLAGAGVQLEITIDIQAEKPNGFDTAEIRTVNENAQTLKFDPGSGFEPR